MRTQAMLLILLVVLTAGCLDGDDPADDTDDGTGTGTDTPDPTPPEDIHDSQTVPGGVTVEQDTGEPVCSLPSEQCIEYPFTIEAGKFKFEATLTWTVPSNDFDLHLNKADGTEVASSVSPPPGTEESISMSLGKGDYVLFVVPYASSADTYELSATFS